MLMERSRRRRVFVFAKDLAAKLDAAITDKDARSSDELSDLLLAFATERAACMAATIPSFLHHVPEA